MRKATLVLWLLLISANASLAQHAPPGDPSTTGFIPERLARIDDAINAEIAADKIPGAVALITRNGKVAYFKSFGFADVDLKTPMRNENIFRIASMTKAVTSVAAMILYEQGHFQLNDPVAKFIPEFADMTIVSAVDDEGNVSATVAATTPIKIIHLLTHTSGIGYPFIQSDVQKSYVDAGIIDGVTIKDIALASQMLLLAEQPLLFESGSEFAYGLSSDLLGYLTATSIYRRKKRVASLLFIPASMMVWSFQRETNPISFSMTRDFLLPVHNRTSRAVPGFPRQPTITGASFKCCSMTENSMALEF